MCGILALTAVIYSTALDAPFHYDDQHSIVDNPNARSGDWLSFFASAEVFSEDPRSAMYRPLVLVSYGLNYALHGFGTWGFRLFNIAVHLATVAMLGLLAHSLVRSAWVAVAAASFFAMHPVNVETVVYISSRSESLCALFYLLSLLLWEKARSEEQRHLWLLVSSLVAFAVALSAKAVAITLPVALLMRELFPWESAAVVIRLRRAATAQWGYWVVGILYLLVTAPSVERALGDEAVRPLIQQLTTQLKALVYYLSMLCVPAKLSVEHQFAIAPGLERAEVLFPLLFFLSAAYVAWACRRVLGRLPLWIAWPPIVLLPTLVIPLNVLVNEHRLYLPAAAFAVAVACAMSRLVVDHRGTGLAMFTALLACYGVLSFQRAQIWQTEHTLWSDALRKGPFMPRPHIYVGDGYHDRGEYERALAEYTTALHIYPSALSLLDRVVIHNNMGASLLKMGRFSEAIQAYQSALRIDSTYSRSRDALDALIALREGGSQEAKRAYKRGLALFLAGRYAEAVGSFTESLSSSSEQETWHALALAYERQGSWTKALGAYEILSRIATSETLRATAKRGIDSATTATQSASHLHRHLGKGGI